MNINFGQTIMLGILLIIVVVLLLPIGILYLKRWIGKGQRNEPDEFMPQGKYIGRHKNGKWTYEKPEPIKPIVYKSRELASRITGISIPIFGISWQAPEPEIKIIRSFLVFLEDRRVLYSPYAFEQEDQVTKSILQIREELTDSLQRLSTKSNASKPLKAMRLACHEYLNDATDNSNSFFWKRWGFLPPLGKLRTIFGYHIAQLAVMYGIDIEGDLAKILPPELQQDIDAIE